MQLDRGIFRGLEAGSGHANGIIARIEEIEAIFAAGRGLGLTHGARGRTSQPDFRARHAKAGRVEDAPRKRGGFVLSEQRHAERKEEEDPHKLFSDATSEACISDYRGDTNWLQICCIR